MTPLENAQSKLDAVSTNYKDALDTVEARLAALPPTATTADVDAVERSANLTGLKADLASAQAQVDRATSIAEARAATSHLIPAGSLSVTEATTYNEHNPEVSYFHDLYSAQRTGSPSALARLQRNNAEVAESRSRFGAEARSTLTTTDFYPPAWMESLWTTSHRARMVYAGLCSQLQLPPYGQTITIPAYTGPTDAAQPQAGDNQAIQTAAGSTAQLTAPIITYAGYCDVSRQSVERALPGLDKVIFGDIARDIARKIEVACLNGSGSNQPKGVFQESGVPAVTITGQTAAQLLLKLADVLQQIEVAVGEPADFILMHSRRFAWLSSLLDSNNRPLVVPAGQGPYQSFATFAQQDATDGLSVAPDLRPSGSMLGVNIYTSPSIPTTSGASTNEDWLLAGVSHLSVRLSDPAGIREFTFDAVASSTGSLRLQGWTYGAYITRYPSAYGIVKGATPPTF
jgi:HK97 family phage major capsid protein